MSIHLFGVPFPIVVVVIVGYILSFLNLHRTPITLRISGQCGQWLIFIQNVSSTWAAVWNNIFLRGPSCGVQVDPSGKSWLAGKEVLGVSGAQTAAASWCLLSTTS